MVVKGVSTRDVDRVANALFGGTVSKSQASRMCAVLNPAVARFRNRSLDEYYPFIIVDAIYYKVRDDERRVLSNAMYLAIGVNTAGKREILGFVLEKEESKDCYRNFFASLKARGLKRTDLVISDSHPGLVEAINEVFLGASWQRCQTHFSKNMLDKTPKKMAAEIKTDLHDIYHAPDIDRARERMKETVNKLSAKVPDAANLLEESFDDITAVLSLHEKYRTKLRTSNAIERVNEEIRRRVRALRIFPSEESTMRIVGTLLLEIHEYWQEGRLYLDMTQHLESREKSGMEKEINVSVLRVGTDSAA